MDHIRTPLGARSRAHLHKLLNDPLTTRLVYKSISYADAMVEAVMHSQKVYVFPVRKSDIDEDKVLGVMKYPKDVHGEMEVRYKDVTVILAAIFVNEKGFKGLRLFFIIRNRFAIRYTHEEILVQNAMEKSIWHQSSISEVCDAMDSTDEATNAFAVLDMKMTEGRARVELITRKHWFSVQCIVSSMHITAEVDVDRRM
jgi:hypothetical protein